MINPFATYAIVAAGLFLLLMAVVSLILWRRSHKLKAERASANSILPTSRMLGDRVFVPLSPATPGSRVVYSATPADGWNTQLSSVRRPRSLSVMISAL